MTMRALVRFLLLVLGLLLLIAINVYLEIR